MQDKRLAKHPDLTKEVEQMDSVAVFGDPKGTIALLTWGSTKGACMEVGEELGLRVVQPTILDPLPVSGLSRALEGAGKIIGVENNATGLLSKLVSCHGIEVDERVLKYDGRPFTVDGLGKRIEEVAK
jgi:2-oxoglutarate ferredoxin oxidoreductase subunit alpha